MIFFPCTYFRNHIYDIIDVDFVYSKTFIYMIFELNTPYINNTFRHIKDVELSNFSIIGIVQTQGINIA
jgi:hypothetical protein